MVIHEGWAGYVVGLKRGRVVERRRLDPELAWVFRREWVGQRRSGVWKEKAYRRVCGLCGTEEVGARRRYCEACRVYRRNLSYHRANVKRGRVKRKRGEVEGYQ